MYCIQLGKKKQNTNAIIKKNNKSSNNEGEASEKREKEGRKGERSTFLLEEELDCFISAADSAQKHRFCRNSR